ncbi:Uncharacterised protein [Salmonella enterica subsp. arizonae]|nr:Uncharacterised protein [Salmonella enterica subsp. arizonae]
MNSRELKLQALADARRRANLNVRTTSNSSTENTQSEITESPPAVYQVPNVNVPENLEEAAKLIQSELQKNLPESIRPVNPVGETEITGCNRYGG